MSSPSPYLGRGGGRAYGLLEVEIAVKSTTSFSSTITNSSSSSPSSTLSESSPLAISTRKTRSSTRRKRPNQTYNEAAALLSTAYPKIFSLPAPLPNHPLHSLPLDSSDLLLPLRALDSATSFLPIREEEPKLAAEVSSRWQNIATGNWKEKAEEEDEEDDFDAESMLDEEFEQVGIDSIMGGTAVMNNEESVINHNLLNYHHPHQHQQTSFVYGYPPGFHHPYWSGGDVRNNNINNNNRAFRRSVDDWWNYPVVDVLQISPRLHSISNNQMTVTTNVDGCGEFEEKTKQSTTTTSGEKTDKNGNSKQKKKLKKKKIAKLGGEEVKEAEETKEDSNFGRNLLKLNYDEVLKEWSGKGSPFPEEIAGGAFLEDGCDASAIAAQIDLFSSDGNSGGGAGVREASVLRYKEKRLSRLFSKKIRYQVRKVNADQRPRMKGRFVRKLSCNKNNRNRSHINHKDDEL